MAVSAANLRAQYLAATVSNILALVASKVPSPLFFNRINK